VRALLDTHAFVWHVQAASDESAVCRALIDDRANELLVSIASCWELAIKASIHRAMVDGPVHEFIQGAIAHYGFNLLPVSLEHVGRVQSLPQHHRDPFDRMLVAQALTEGIPILSRDSALDAYGVQRLW
jgi:PIN domain nuclease of toxin-antitoxin system